MDMMTTGVLEIGKNIAAETQDDDFFFFFLTAPLHPHGFVMRV